MIEKKIVFGAHELHFAYSTKLLADGKVAKTYNTLNFCQSVMSRIIYDFISSVETLESEEREMFIEIMKADEELLHKAEGHAQMIFPAMDKSGVKISNFKAMFGKVPAYISKKGLAKNGIDMLLRFGPKSYMAKMGVAWSYEIIEGKDMDKRIYLRLFVDTGAKAEYTWDNADEIYADAKALEALMNQVSNVEDTDVDMDAMYESLLVDVDNDDSLTVEDYSNMSDSIMEDYGFSEDDEIIGDVDDMYNDLC